MDMPTTPDRLREAVLLPPDITRTSIVYPVTVNGRLIRYGVRAEPDTKVDPEVLPVISDLVLACVVVDLAESTAINIYRPVTNHLLGHLREMAAAASAAARERLGAPLVDIRAPIALDAPPHAPAKVTAIIRASGITHAAPAVQVVHSMASHDGAPLARYANELPGIADPDQGARALAVTARILETLIARGTSVALGAETGMSMRLNRHLEDIVRRGTRAAFSISAASICQDQC